MLFVTVDTPDPYLILRIKTAPEGRRRTKTKDNEVNPVWNEEFTFFLDGAVDNKLRMFTNPRQMVSYHLFSSRCKELQSILFAWSFWFEGRGGRELSPDSILSICLSTIHQVRANRRKKLCRFAKQVMFVQFTLHSLMLYCSMHAETYNYMYKCIKMLVLAVLQCSNKM